MRVLLKDYLAHFREQVRFPSINTPSTQRSPPAPGSAKPKATAPTSISISIASSAVEASGRKQRTERRSEPSQRSSPRRKISSPLRRSRPDLAEVFLTSVQPKTERYMRYKNIAGHLLCIARIKHCTGCIPKSRYATPILRRPCL